MQEGTSSFLRENSQPVGMQISFLAMPAIAELCKNTVILAMTLHAVPNADSWISIVNHRRRSNRLLAATKTEHQVQSALLLDVVVAQRPSVLELFA